MGIHTFNLIFVIIKWFQCHGNCGPLGPELLWLGDADDERKNWEAILAKCRTAHANMSKLQLKAQEFSTQPVMNESHKTLVAKITGYNTVLVTKVSEYAHICTTHTIPKCQQPTTTDLLKKKIETVGGWPFQFVSLAWGLHIPRGLQVRKGGFERAPCGRADGKRWVLIHTETVSFDETRNRGVLWINIQCSPQG